MLDFGFYNMDCLEGMKEFPDKYFDLAIVDPVYGDVTQGGYMKREKYNNNIWKQEKTGKDYFKELFRCSKEQIIFGGNYFTEETNKNSQCWIVWDKLNDGSTYADGELAWTSFNKALRIFRYRWKGFIQENMKQKEERIHPTQKPVALYVWILENFAKDTDVILDTHVGSGSSLIACHKTRHKYVGFEIDEGYFNSATERIKTEQAQISIFDFLI